MPTRTSTAGAQEQPETAPATPPSGTTPKKASATEKPVIKAESKNTAQYVVTMDNATGRVLKIETLNSDTGERKELTAAEYAQSTAYANLAQTPYNAPGNLGQTPYYVGYGAFGPSYSAASLKLAEAYYGAIGNYWKALTSQR